MLEPAQGQLGAGCGRDLTVLALGSDGSDDSEWASDHSCETAEASSGLVQADLGLVRVPELGGAGRGGAERGGARCEISRFFDSFQTYG